MALPVKARLEGWESLVEMFIKAANDARINELGKPYSSKDMKLFLTPRGDSARN